MLRHQSCFKSLYILLKLSPAILKFDEPLSLTCMLRAAFHWSGAFLSRTVLEGAPKVWGIWRREGTKLNGLDQNQVTIVIWNREPSSRSFIGGN